ncbi:hypothetical protein ES705_41156 [subsurface metagenome]
MKKLIYLLVAIVVLGLIASGCLPVVPTLGEKGNGNGNGNGGLQPGIDFNGPHYNLNLIGKKADWSGGGSYDNPDRHTIFVPEDTTSYFTPNGESGITIWMTQGDEFAVLDGNAFDGEAAFQLGPGKYKVYIVAKAKPGGYTDITGWVYAEDEYGAFYYFDIGSVHVTKSKKWKDATHIFYVSTGEDIFDIITEDTWVFEYMAQLEAALLDPLIVDTAYFWQYDNHGNKLVKVRFYKD